MVKLLLSWLDKLIKISLGTHHTLQHYLHSHIPLLFGPDATGAVKRPNMSADQAYVLIQGVSAPLEAEMAWLGACMAGADGWLNVCIGVKKGI